MIIRADDSLRDYYSLSNCHPISRLDYIIILQLPATVFEIGSVSLVSIQILRCPQQKPE